MKQCNVEAEKTKNTCFPWVLSEQSMLIAREARERKWNDLLVITCIINIFILFLTATEPVMAINYITLLKKKSCTGSLLLRAFSSLCEKGLVVITSLVVMHGLMIVVAFLISEQRLLILDPIVMVHRPSHLRGMWDLPGPGTQPVSPALPVDSQPLDHQGHPQGALLRGLWILTDNTVVLLLSSSGEVLPYWVWRKM